jgi:DeoR family galactitol utilization operon repressor
MLAQMSEREKHILEMLSEEADISIQQLSDELGVSQVTIRSDLSSLESKGVILRLRGGALPAFHPDILEHQKNNPAIKKRIAQAAAELVSDGDTIMVNDGTTTSMIPRYLLGKRDIRLVTNSTLVLPYARVNPSLHTMLIGGEFKASTEAIVGSQALAQLETFHVRYVFIGTGGFSVEKGLTTHLQEGAEIAKKMAGLGDKIVLTADSSKYGRKGFVNFLPLEKVDIVITDKGISAAARQAMAEIGLELILV